ncbi:SDR family NAD(P)-dependent oxidoreductase [Pseudomonas piscis]|uniref:SDR family NAD(P)-dependent oxidoreductase n=1 Tax=Pseudomonas piscis TaxID=2614538 RepID=UPI00384CB34D
MDSRIRALHGRIQRQEINPEQAAREFEMLRASLRAGPAGRRLQVPTAGADLVAAAVYRYDEPCLRDHRFDQRRILLGLTYASLALEQGLGQLAEGEALRLNQLLFAAPVALASGEQLEVAIRAGGPGFEAVCRRSAQAPWQVAASGELTAVAAEHQAIAPVELSSTMTRLDPASIYQVSEQLFIGDSYRTLQALYRQPERPEVLARVVVDDERHYGLHPLLINSAFLSIVPLLDGESLSGMHIPLGIKSLTLHRRQAPMSGWIRGQLLKNSGELLLFDAGLYSDDGELVAQFSGCSLKRLRNSNLEPALPTEGASREAIEAYLLAQLHGIGASGISRQQRQRNLMDLGLESAHLVDLAQRIASATAIELEPTVFFEYPSLVELAGFLWQEHGAAFGRLLDQPDTTDTTGTTPAPVPNSAPTARAGHSDASEQDIAIIGQHGQFAEAGDLEQFWRNIWHDRELIKTVPEDHWDIAPWFDADPEAKDKTYSRWGSFIDGVDRFDAGFFNMSRREAQWMDPQVRLLLQSAYTCAEDAGVIRRLRGSDTGVFIGSCFNEYVDKIGELGLPMDPYIATGSGTIAANRISFWFDLKGPSLMFNTACSSSLVALHAACVALRNGECGMALVGGSNLLLSSWHYRYFSTIRALSPTGRCHTFDTRADGYVPGECVATLLLKPLSRALADGDPIHAVIKGSAALHGGYTPSLTAPSVTGEENVIVQAWRNAGIDPRTLGYIEAHGTGTRLGDPIEINALKRAFARYTQDRGFCHIGSVKANIGHAEGAAGIAGVLKVVQQLKHRKLPALGHFQEQNPHIRLDDSPLLIDVEGRDWPEQATPRRAGVSSFGFSGTNAHAVLEEYRELRRFAIHHGQPVLVPLSARDDTRLRQQVQQLLAYLEHQAPDLGALAYTLQVGREAMAARAIFLVTDLQQLQHQLQAWSAGERDATFAAASLDINQALDRADLSQLAALWLSEPAQSIDWERLHDADCLPARISLPGYAFAQDRYWLEAPAQGTTTGEATSLGTGSADSALLGFSEQWLAVAEPEGEARPLRVLCLLGDPSLRRQLADVAQTLSPGSELLFVSAALANEPEEDGQRRVAAQDPQRLQHGLHQALADFCPDRVLYLWAMDDRRWSSDSSPIVALLKAMAASARPIQRLLLAGRARDVLERCHLESWIGIERSLGTLLDCPVTVAIDCPQDSPDDHRWLPRVWRQLSGEVLGSRLYQDLEPLRPTLIPVTLEAGSAPLALERLDTLLITGGLGELGWLLASHLSQRARQRSSGRLQLLLNGRSPLSASARARIEALGHARCRVFHVQADCADGQALTAALAQVLVHSGPIDGLVHAAGLKASGNVLASSPQEVAAVLKAKVEASQVLDQVLAEQPLALICHFSSSSALLGDMGACSYAMANRFQQAYARHVQAKQARRVVTINWPLWREGGMTLGEGDSTEFYLKSSGQRLLESAEGLDWLERAVASDIQQVMVLAGQPERLRQLVAGIDRPLAKPQAATVASTRHAGAGRPELKGLSLEQALAWDLRDLASRPLQAERQALDDDRNLADFGFDSISLAEYAGLLSRHLGLKLTPEVFFSHSTLAKLAAYLLTQHRQAVEACYLRPQGPAPAPEPEPELEPATPMPQATSPGGQADSIAIIGLSGRFPGARSPEELWQLLAEGRDMVDEIAPQRYDWREHYGDPRENPAKTRCIWMGSVPGIDEFDPLFFEISPREASQLDPRQRLLLQEGWNVLEDAGIGPRQLAAQRVGMFVGVEEGDFQRLAGEESLTSSHNGILASRLAYFLNLTGPAMAINTACSSALVALHQAASSLRNQECEMAIAAGVNLIFSADAFIGMTQAGMLSPDGKCFAFDHRANGMVPGEAVCCVLLKPLARAEADGDRIYATLRASGINYDGKTNGITAPSGASQQRLLEDVYRRAGLQTREVDYIVAHGTGTQLGDPVEINALNDAFRGNPPGHCALTSTKTNLGHTFAASGLVSVIALVQALRHETIPASLHCEQENDYIQWQQSPFYVNKANKAWPRAGRGHERIGAVSAFGMSGTNAHVVLQDYSRQPAAGQARQACYLLVLSAKSAEALQDRAAQLKTALERGGYLDEQLPSISHTLLEGRHHFRHRLALVAADLQETCYALQCHLAGEKRPNLFAGEVDRDFTPGKTVVRYIEQLQGDCRGAEAETLRESLAGLADCYRQGYELDGGRLFATPPARIALPGYPFARERYWPQARQRQSSATGPQAQWLHPLLQRNLSTLARPCFASRFSGQERFLVDHRIGEQRVFPAVAYLEMAREAIVRASERTMQHVTLCNLAWLRPLVLSTVEAGEIELFCELTPQAADRLSFKIYSLDGSEQQLHAQGDALLAAVVAPAALDLAQLEAGCDLGERSHEALYQGFASLGVHYGSSFRAAGQIRLGRDQVLGQLSAGALDPQMNGVALPPGILDSALHIATVLGQGPQATGPALPFALDRLRVHGSLAQALRDGPLTVLASRGALPAGTTIDKVDLQIHDQAGQCLLQLEGFSSRRTQDQASVLPVTQARQDDSELARSIRTPSWQSLDDPGEPLPEGVRLQLLLLGLPDTVVTRLREQFGAQVSLLPGAPGATGAAVYEAAALALLDYLQRRDATAGDYLQLYVVQGQSDLRLGALEALLGTAMIENGQLQARLVLLDPDLGEAGMYRMIEQQSRVHCRQRVRVLANGSLYARQWHELAVASKPQREPGPWRDGGVYAITGGAGGLGLLFARHIARSCRNPVLYLAGRSASEPKMQQAFEQLQALGARVFYQALDVADAAAVNRWIDAIHAGQGELHGVIHSAGVIRDGLIPGKRASDFSQVLAAKVRGLEALDLAVGERPLDFFVCCSSQAALGNLGQADYACANAWMDAYMHYRQALCADGKRKGRSLSINWPLWRDGGMGLAPVIEQQLRERFGIVPMPQEVGLQSLQLLLAESVTAQAWVVYGEAARLAGIGLAPAGQGLPPAGAPPRVDSGASLGDSELRQRIQAFIVQIVAKVTQVDAAKIHPAEKFEAYGFDSIMAVGVTNELEKHLGSLPKTLLFEHVNIAGMVEHFAQKYRQHFAAMFAGDALTPAAGIAQGPSPVDRFARAAAAVASASKQPVPDSDLAQYVAVIGLGGHYPGADDIDQLWRNLANGVDCMDEFPAERWDHAKLYYKNRDVLGKTTCINGSFIKDVDKFDYSYFKMPKVYADHMSPEVRLFLQTAVHTFEDAGYSRETLQRRYGGNVGVLLGAMSNDYHYYGFEHNLSAGAMASGSGMATIPMTVSYFYGLTGPSLFIDTMCSSSSTCIHTAFQMLRHDETMMVLAGGLNLMYHPYTVVNTSQGNFTSITSRSVNSYGVGADGTVIGEGVGAVLLKRLDRAIADRDQIYGVIKGSAITNAGERNGFNVPNPDLQTLAIRQAMEQAKVHPASISYVEGHGSGTRLGDPIEVLGLRNAFMPHTQDKQFCYLGSIKSNIGHLLAASGVAGLTKTLLQLKHGQIAPSIHSGVLNQDIDFADSPFKVPQQLVEWRRPEHLVDGRLQSLPRRAGLTSIAAGGMNAHMIVEEFVPPADAAGQIADECLAFVFSVHKLALLAENLRKFRTWLASSDASLAQVAYTLQVGKNNLRNRLVIRCANRQALLDGLAECIEGRYDNASLYHFQETTASRLPRADEPLAALLGRWLGGDNDVDWTSLYERQPQRISLPAYAFEKNRCWYTEPGYESAIINPSMFTRKLHPLVSESCPSTAEGALFRCELAPAQLLDYLYRAPGGQRLGAFNFVDVALAMPALVERFDGSTLAVSCAFEHFIGDWATVGGLRYRLLEIDAGQLELDFDALRQDGQSINLGFALINPLAGGQPVVAQSWLDAADELLSRQPATDASERLARAGYDFAPYLENTGGWVVGGSGLLLEGRPPLNRHNHHAANLHLTPYLATTLDKAFYLLLDQLGLGQAQVVIRNIEQLCCYQSPAGDFTVVLSGIGLGTDGLACCLLVLDEQARICLKADRVSLHLDQRQLAAIDHDHPWLAGQVADVSRSSLQASSAGEAKPQVARADTGAGDPGDQVLAFIQEQLQHKLGFSPEEIGQSAQVHDLGLDSIMVMQLTDSLNKRFGTRLMPDLFYEKQQLGELAARLQAQHKALH